MNVGAIEYIRIRSEVNNRRLNTLSLSKWSTEHVLEHCRKLKEEVTILNANSIKTATMGQLSLYYLRSFVKYVFHNTRCKVNLNYHVQARK